MFRKFWKFWRNFWLLPQKKWLPYPHWQRITDFRNLFVHFSESWRIIKLDFQLPKFSNTPFFDFNNTRMISFVNSRIFCTQRIKGIFAIKGLFALWEIETAWLYCGIPRYLINLEKILFNTFAFPWSVLIISHPSTSVIFSL